MSVEQLETAILRLSRDDQKRLALWFEQHLADLFGDDADWDISDEQKREILRRQQELRNNPELAQPIDDDYFDRLRQKVSDAFPPKASAS